MFDAQSLSSSEGPSAEGTEGAFMIDSVHKKRDIPSHSGTNIGDEAVGAVLEE